MYLSATLSYVNWRSSTQRKHFISKYHRQRLRRRRRRRLRRRWKKKSRKKYEIEVCATRTKHNSRRNLYTQTYARALTTHTFDVRCTIEKFLSCFYVIQEARTHTQLNRLCFPSKYKISRFVWRLFPHSLCLIESNGSTRKMNAVWNVVRRLIDDW